MTISERLRATSGKGQRAVRYVNNTNDTPPQTPAEMERIIIRQRATIDALIAAGRGLSNTAFNLAQDDHPARVALESGYKAWDAALSKAPR
jgi:hypothetical protein